VNKLLQNGRQEYEWNGKNLANIREESGKKANNRMEIATENWRWKNDSCMLQQHQQVVGLVQDFALLAIPQHELLAYGCTYTHT
jgi:hypothetical protein